ncbi:MAG: hypothetical protein J6X55_12610 [Victivallales bacterium]|nr:hypothetical protein [Victivallales bacterium]
MNTKDTFTAEEKRLIKAKVPEVRQLLLDNLAKFTHHPLPLLKCGDIYNGLWLEHNQDNFFLADYAPENAWAAMDALINFQREDGLIPFHFGLGEPDDPKTTSFGQVQCVWAFTRCALEIAKKTHRPPEDLQRLYDAGVRYDQWFAKYRNHAGTGLAEMFCEYDTGHDNDPRVTDDGIPRACPGKDAINMPDLPIMPVLSVDLSAMLYGNRIALAELATMLGKTAYAGYWATRASELASAIDKYLYDPIDNFYYDRDTRGFRKYRTEHITRLFLNHVLPQARFDSIYEQHFLQQGKGFCAPYPIPSVAIDDPHFDKTCPKNSWGCNTQALTTERAILWMTHYGRKDDLVELLSRWMRAFIKYDSKFPQEINPFTGAPIGDSGNYCPALIIFLEAAKVIFG